MGSPDAYAANAVMGPSLRSESCGLAVGCPMARLLLLALLPFAACGGSRSPGSHCNPRTADSGYCDAQNRPVVCRCVSADTDDCWGSDADGEWEWFAGQAGEPLVFAWDSCCWWTCGGDSGWGQEGQFGAVCAYCGRSARDRAPDLGWRLKLRR